MKKKTDITTKPVQLNTNPGLPTQFIDQIQVVKRGSGEQYLIRFFTRLPEGTFEHSRIMVDSQLFKNLIANNIKEIDETPLPDQKPVTKH